MRLFQVDEVGGEGEQREKVGGVDDDEKDDGADRSLLSVHVQEADDNEERYGVDRCFEPGFRCVPCVD